MIIYDIWHIIHKIALISQNNIFSSISFNDNRRLTEYHLQINLLVEVLIS